MRIKIYNELIVCFDEIKNLKLKLRYDLQDLFNYYINISKKNNDYINIIGLNYLPNTLNGLSMWSLQGNTHCTIDGLNNLYYDENKKLKTKYYPTKNIDLISFTFGTLLEIWNTQKFKELFPIL